MNSEIEHAAARRGAPDAKVAGEHEAGARVPGSVVPFPGRVLKSVESVQEGLGHLARLELELAIAEVKHAATSAGIAVGVAVAGAVTLVTSLIVLLAAALAPIFGGDWRPLLIAGGGGALLSGAAIAWAVYRVRNVVTLARTRASIKETWRWAETRLRSGRTSPSPVTR